VDNLVARAGNPVARVDNLVARAGNPVAWAGNPDALVDNLVVEVGKALHILVVGPTDGLVEERNLDLGYHREEAKGHSY
jgi:hypothetical protein